MEVVLKLNVRLQPMHRHELEDAIQGVLEKEQMGEVTSLVQRNGVYHRFHQGLIHHSRNQYREWS